MNTTKLALVFLVGSVLLAATYASQSDLMEGGWHILRARGPAAAYQYFQQRVTGAKPDPRLLYGQAWTAFREGQFDEAHRLADRIETTRSSGSWRASIAYLRGSIDLGQGAYQNSEAWFAEAVALYTTGEEDANLHRALLGQAQANMDLGNLNRTAELLDLASQIDKDVINFADYFDISSRLHFWNGDYLAAMEDGILQLKAAEGDPHALSRAYSSLGFYYLLSGHLETGKRFTEAAHELIVAAGDIPQYHFNQINDLLYQKCTGADTSYLAESATRWGRNTHNPRILKFIDFVVAFDCEGQRISDGVPSPPSLPGDDGGGGG